jgi:hypothetical protein
VFSIDHVVLAVADLDEAGERLWREHGLASVPGGRHARWGTGNRVVPLGDSYVELISVVDPGVGRTTELGRRLLDLVRDGRDRWFALSVADPQIEATASRLGLRVEEGARTRTDGVELRWRSAGIEDPGRDAWLPFFIRWDVPAELHPGRTPATHRASVTGIERVDVAGDPARFRAWVGEDAARLPVRIVGGEPGVRAVVLAADGGEGIVLGDGDPA